MQAKISTGLNVLDSFRSFGFCSSESFTCSEPHSNSSALIRARDQLAGIFNHFLVFFLFISS